MDYARRSMQRVGFLRWTLKLASPGRTQSLESITRAFEAAITEKSSAPEKLADAYHSNSPRKAGRAKRLSGTSIQLQDIYLHQPGLPSSTGAITGDIDRKGYLHTVYVEIPTWAVKLNLLREKNYTLTDRGRIMTLEYPDRSGYSQTEGNPLLLSASERLVALYCLIEGDGDFLKALHRRLLPTPVFSRQLASDHCSEALRDLKAMLPQRASGKLLQLATKLDKAIHSLTDASKSNSPREHIATPRLEPLVDCGLLLKSDPSAYEYEYSGWGHALMSALVAAESVDHFIRSGLVTHFISQNHANSPAALDYSIVAAPYMKLRSGLGYVSLRELAVASSAYQVALNNPAIPEIGTVEEFLLATASDGSRNVRLAVGRGGGIAQVRINPRALAGFYEA